MELKQRPCRDWRRKKGCIHGFGCLFSHKGHGRFADRLLTTAGDTQRCGGWGSRFGCRRGGRCRYAHLFFFFFWF